MEGKLMLVKPDMTMAEEIASYRNEFLEAGSSMDGTGSLRKCENPADWIEFNRTMENPKTVPAHLVAASQYAYVRESDGRIVGMIQLRHELNEYLKNYGGHIGYSVRPSERKKGYAGKMLADFLPVCRRMGLGRVLVTCLTGNEASRRTILKNGGVYENTVFEPDLKANLERYWIDLQHGRNE